MFIKRVNLIDFGKFHNKTFSFDRKLNIIYGENESGKSTIYKFIEVMTYAINRIAHNLPINNKEDLSRYIPWSNQGSCKGEMVVEHENREYKIICNFLDIENDTRLYKVVNGIEEKIEDFNEIHFDTLGLKNISNVANSELIEDIEGRIINKSITNSEEIRFKDIVSSLAEKLNSIVESPGYKDGLVAYKEMEHVLEDVDDIKIIYNQRESIKTKIKDLATRISAIDDSVDYLENSKREISFYQTEQIKEKIGLIDDEIEELKEFEDISSEDYKEYVDLKEHLNELIAQIESVNNEIKLVKNEKKIIAANNNVFLLEKIADVSFYNSFNNDMEQYQKFRREEEIIEEDIEKAKEYLRQLQSENNRISRPKDLERDYHNIQLQSNLLEMHKTQNNYDADIDLYNGELKEYIGKRNILTVYLVVAVVLAASAFVASYFIGDLMTILTIVGVICFLVAVVVLVIIINNNYNVDKIKHKKLFLEKNNLDAKSEENKLQTDILKEFNKYGCSTMEEFEEYYTNLKGAAKNIEIARRDLSLFEKQLLSLDSKKVSIIRHIENKMQQCEMIGMFETDDIEHIKEYIDNNREMADKQSNLGNKVKELELDKERISYKQVEVEKELNNEKFIKFRNFAYDKILEYKQKLFELIRKKNQLTDEYNVVISKFSEEEIGVLENKAILIEDANAKLTEIETRVTTLVGDRQKLIDESHRLGQEMIDIQETLYGIDKKIINNRKVEKQYQQNKAVVENYEVQINSLQKILYVLNVKSKDIQADISKRLMNTIDEHINRITKRYHKMHITDALEVELETYAGDRCNLQSVSLGTFDQVYFAVRIGLMKMFDKNESVSVILDDAFVQYDIERFQHVMGVINDLEEQVIVFTCYDREEQYATEHQYDVNYMLI